MFNKIDQVNDLNFFNNNKDVEKFIIYDVAALSKALNRENTVHLAVKKGPMSEMVRNALQRYQTFLNA